jgi:arylsulfatase A-like enzyme
MSDQQRWDSLGCYGQTAIKTPNLDNLAAAGVLFENCYANNPICTPARASMLTGKHILGHGVTKLYDVLPDDEILFTKHLQDAGYKTALIGKLHVSSGVREQTYRHPNDGFDIYDYCIEASVGMDSPFNGYVKWLEERNPEFLQKLREKRRGLKNIPEEYHFTHWATEKTIEFINQADSNQPFFCFMSVFDPHNPYDDYPIEYADQVNQESLHNIIPAAEGDDSIYALQQERQLSYLGPANSFSQDDIMEMRLGYYASLALLDKEVGRVLDALEQKGIVEDTLVIFVSDHGDSLGDHGLFVKGVHLYDEAIRVPFMMRWPGHIPAGRRLSGLVQLHDLAATLLSAADIGPPDTMPDSANLLPLCNGEVEQVHPYAFCLYRNTGINDQKDYFNPPLNSTMIRNDQYKLIFYHAVPEAGIEAAIQLFKILDDPDEQNNLVHHPAYADIKAHLLVHLADWLHHQSQPLESRGGEALPGEAWKSVINNRF